MALVLETREVQQIAFDSTARYLSYRIILKIRFKDKKIIRA